MNPRKVETIVNWEQPRNVTKIQSFQGLARYYRRFRRFMEYFSLIFAPLTRLTRKRVKFEWDEKYEQSFQELKNRLIIAPVLTLSITRVRYVVFSNASKQCLGCVLMQGGRVIVYAFRNVSITH